jgi:phosphoribosylanthranilate isomerase
MMIKICGITRREDALEAAEAGASAIGFIFYPKSPRYVTPEKAAGLGEDIAALKVGVFVDESPAAIEDVMRAAKLDVAQIYGGAGGVPDGARVWRAFRVPVESCDLVESVMALEEAGVFSNADAVLLDGPGNGASFDWEFARGLRDALRDELGASARVIVAGGLDASNVAQAIREAEPWGVDASSRLESAPGIKDHKKVREFIKAAQAPGAGDKR